MSRTFHLAQLATLALASWLHSAVAAPAGAEAQRGQITGLEMSIEGTLQVHAQEEQVLLVTLHAVSGADALLPVGGARLKVTASYRADGPIAELRTDRHGQATIPYTPPHPGSFEIVVDAFHGSHSRRFRVPVQASNAASLTVAVLPERPEPGTEALAHGYAIDDEERPLVGREVRVGIPGREPVVVRTDARGAFVTALRMPEAGTHEVRASIEVERVEDGTALPGAVGSAQVVVAEVEVPTGLRARAVPRRRVVAPGEPIEVDVEVRDGLGRPVRATVTRAGAADEPVRADERGIAAFAWTAPRMSGIVDQTAEWHIALPGEAPIVERTLIRIAAAPAAADIAAEGGALVPGVPTQLFVHAVRPDGTPHVGPVVLFAPRIGRHRLTTDASGHGSVEVVLAEEGGPDTCGGATAVSIEVGFPHQAGEDGDSAATTPRCLPVDPDASVRVRATAAGNEGERLQVVVHRRTAVAREPVSVTVMRRRGGALVPLSQHVLAPDGRELTIERASGWGPLLVRARALVGAGQAEVRGTFARVAPRRAPKVRVEELAAASDESRTLAALVLPAAEAEALATRSRPADHLAEARTIPRDLGAPHLLVRGQPQPADPVEDAVALGILRDPWRQRALFREGRLALVFRAFETAVAEAAEEDGLQGLAHRRGGRWRFNDEVVRRLDDGGLGPEGARDLGGEPLTVERLRQMDRAFSFDSVARRVTRKRLIELLQAWRPWVRERDLDPAFAPHADPRYWWATFVEEQREGWPVDGWGNPIHLHPRRGGDEGPVVVPGWRITSPGPDGRLGTGDDLADPFTRMIPEGLYAESVGEAELVHALRRGVLDRETVRLLDPGQPASGGAIAGVAGELPSPIADEPAPFLEPSKHYDVALGRARPETRLPPASIPHRVVALAFGGAEGLGVATAPLPSREDARLATHFPERLHGGAPLALPLVVVAAARAEGLTLAVEAEGTEATLVDARVGTLGTGAAVERTLRLEPQEGAERAEVRVRLLRDGRPIAERRFRAPVVDGTPERTLWAGRAVAGDWRARLAVPENARRPRTRLVVLAPGRIDADPLLAYPAIPRAWAKLMAGEGSAVHLAELPAPADPVEAAQLMLLQTALGEPSQRVDPRARRLLRHRRRRRDEGQSTDAESARILAVLSSVALPRWSDAPQGRDAYGPAGTAHRLRQGLWQIHETDPVARARVAAALLLTDADDPQGRAAFVRARRDLVRGREGGRVVPHEDPREQLAGSAALALAAHLLGDERTRDALLRGLGARTHLAADPSVDGAFWLLAASVHGAFGRGPGEARVRRGQASDELTFRDGLATLEWDPEGEVDVELTTAGGSHLTRLETRYGRPVEARRDAPLRVALEGIAGRANRRAGYEIRVEAPTATVTPVLAITLPAGARLEASALEAMRAAPGVAEVAEPDARGVLRVRLEPLPAEQERRLPLPLRWTGAGRRQGLALAAWDASRPWQVTSVPARTIDVR